MVRCDESVKFGLGPGRGSNQQLIKKSHLTVETIYNDNNNNNSSNNNGSNNNSNNNINNNNSFALRRPELINLSTEIKLINFYSVSEEKTATGSKINVLVDFLVKNDNLWQRQILNVLSSCV